MSPSDEHPRLDFADKNPFYGVLASEPAGELTFDHQGTFTVRAEQLRDAVDQALNAGKAVWVEGQVLMPGYLVEVRYTPEPPPVHVSLWWRWRRWWRLTRWRVFEHWG